MSTTGEGTGKTPPEIKTNEKVSLTVGSVGDAVRRLSCSDIPSKGPFRMANSEALKGQLDVKLPIINEDLDNLQTLLETSPINLDDVKDDWTYVVKQMEDFNTLKSKYLELLVKEGKIVECAAEEKRFSALAKRRAKMERLVAEAVTPSLPVAKTIEDTLEEEMEVEYELYDNLMVEIARKEKIAVELVPQSEWIVYLARIKYEAEKVREKHDRYCQSLLQKGDKDKYKMEKALMQRSQANQFEVMSRIEQYMQVPAIHIASPGGHDHHRFSLPRRELPKFNGDVRKWLQFWAIFEEIDKDPQIPNVHKLDYLVQATESGSQAYKLVSSYPMSGSNYRKAVDHLRETYGRENVLVKVYVRDLLDLMLQNSSGDRRMEFVELVTQLTSQLRNLGTLGVTQDKCAQILYPVVESCLPQDILTAWQRHSNFKEELEDLITFLQSEVNNRIERSLAQSQFSSSKSSSSSSGGQGGRQGGGGKQTATAATLHNGSGGGNGNSQPQRQRCCFCERRHPSLECWSLPKVPYEVRREILIKNNLCFICFEPHWSRECSKSELKCSTCKGKGGKLENHQALLCPKLRSSQTDGGAVATANNNTTTENNGDEQKPSSSQQMTNLSNPEVPLQTLLVTVYGQGGRKKNVRALLDTGSQRSFLVQHVADELQLNNLGEEEIIYQLFGGAESNPQKHNTVKLYVSSLKEENNCNFLVSVCPVVTSEVSPPKKGFWMEEFVKRGVSFPDADSTTERVDLLIGNDIAPRLYTGRIVDLDYGPVAMETLWGWVLCGKLPVKSTKKKAGCQLIISTLAKERSLSDLWSLDAIGITDPVERKERKQLEEETQQHFEENVVQLADGRYEVALPWLAGTKENLPSNHHIAKRRLQRATKGLQEDGYLEKYHQLLEQWEKDGMISEVPEDEIERTAHYLPHRAVIKLSSSTTPVRPVFDASAHSRGKLSLNESLEKGPNLLELIPSLITRFRLHEVGMTSDVKKAFQQISVKPADRDYLRFLWWSDLSCQKLKIYQHDRVVFGVSSSPYLLGATLQHHLKKAPPTHQVVGQHLMKSLYVDNCVASVSNVGLALEFKEKCEQLLLPAHFDLRGWEFGPTLEEKIVPILGLQWNTKQDTLELDLSGALERADKPPTQRNVLSLAHSIFDPMGFVSPFTILAKTLLRKCHNSKLGWDSPLPTEIEEEFAKWKKQIPLLSEVKVRRFTGFGACDEKGLHVFCDASQEACAAVIFLRCVSVDGEVTVSLVQAKSRLAPTQKTVSIPRLELIACNIGSRLLRSVLDDLEDDNIPVVMWTDSMTALAWITGDGPWGTFVDNRCREVKTLTDVGWWRHIPGKLNPADTPSRGISARKLVDMKWWEGPEWLSRSPDEWPVSDEQPDMEAVVAEKRKTVVTASVAEHHHPLREFLKVSVYPKMLRFVAYWRRYMKLLMRKAYSTRMSGEREAVLRPTHEEYQDAEMVMLRHAQQKFQEKPSRLKQFTTTTDEKGLLRVRTRLTHEDEDNFKLPILLPDDDPYVFRLIRWEHVRVCHAGTQVLLGHLRENYWITNGRRAVRKVVKSCWTCKWLLGNKLEVPEAPLPDVRTTTGVPFAVTGIDCAGPLILKDKMKVWVVLFTCATYRAIHLELVDSMSTQAFLLAFRNFVNFRGRPAIVYSDNGLNFVGAKRVFEKVDWKKVEEEMTVGRIEWRLNPPTAAWWGGWWERLIGLVKQLLRRMLGKRVVNYLELSSLLREVENVVNGRPLTYLGETPSDPAALTPNHFIRNAGLAFLPDLDVRDAAGLRLVYKKMQRLREALRSRFRLEYLGQLKIAACTRRQEELKVGDVVLVETDNAKRLDWPLGIVLDAITGRDGVVRTYRVKTRAGEILRPAQRLFPMEQY